MRRLLATRRLGDRLRTDVALAAVAVVLAAGEVAVNDFRDEPGRWLLALVPAGFALWHRAPGWAAAWVALLVAGVRPLEAPLWAQFVPFASTMVLAYAAGARMAGSPWLVALVLGAAPFANLIGTEEMGVADLPFGLLLAGAPFGAGRLVRRRRVVRNQLELRAVELEFEREEAGRLAAAHERARIARDLHDVVSHSLTAMVVQAGGARRIADRDPGSAAQALRTVARTGRESLAELDQLLGVVDLDPAASPGLGAVGRLVEQARAAGVDARLTVTGLPVELDPDRDLNAYRIVQEALTNVAKHAAGARADVHVDRRGTFVDITVADDGGRGPSDPTSGDGSGHGLRGMRERAELYGGHAKAGPTRRGWRVEARLPSDTPAPVAAVRG